VTAKADVPFDEVTSRAAMLTQTPMVARTERSHEAHRVPDMTRKVDDTLEGSFPASDPPSWTASVATLAPTVDPSSGA
jgi:hypothetical protein